MSLIFCGSGHRPRWFPDQYNMESQWVKDLRMDLTIELGLRKPDRVISGMALGWDMMIAEAAMELMIPVHAYIPFAEQGANWPRETREKYDEILEKVDALFICSKEYHRQCFFKRDYLMIEHSDEVFALLNPAAKSGGTFATLKYAKTKGKKIKNFWRD